MPEHVNGDVADRDRAELGRERAAVGVAVQDEVGAVRADRRGEARRAEERPDRLRLADERLRDRGVVEQDDPAVAARDRLEPRLERLDLARRLGVDLPQQRLAEVGQLGAGEAADEPLGADDPELEPADLVHGVVALEHADAGVLEHGDHLVAAIRVIVVVAEHRVDRQLERTARVGEHGRLLGLAVRRQVAREQHDVRVPLQRRERVRDPLAQRLRAVDVSSGGNTDHRLGACSPAAAFTNGIRGIGREPWPLRPPTNFPELLDAMKVAAAALRDAEVPYLLGGGLAAWARGGPPTEHDVDFFVREEDAERALEALVAGRHEARAPARGLAAEGVGRRRR